MASLKDLEPLKYAWSQNKRKLCKIRDTRENFIEESRNKFTKKFKKLIFCMYF